MIGLSGRTIAAILVALAVVVLAATAMNSVFFGSTAVMVAGAAASLAAIVSIGFWRLGLTGAPVVFGHAGLLLAIAGLVLFSGDGFGLEMLSASWEGSTSGWVDLLRRTIPTEATGPLVMPVAVLAWATMAVTTELLLRSSRPVLGLVVLVLAVYGYVLLGTAAANRPSIAMTISVLLLGFLWLSTKQPLAHTTAAAASPQGRRGIRAPADVRAIGLAAGLAAVAVLLAAGLARLVDENERWSPRATLAPPIDIRSQVSPLAELKAQLTTENPATLFTAEIVGDTVPGDGLVYLRTVALDSYDGVLWRSDTSFPIFGSTLETDAEPGVGDTGQLRIVTTEQYDSHYLPVVGDPRSTTLSEVGFSATTDTLVLADPATNVDYVVEYVETATTDERVLGASADTDGLGSLFVTFDERRGGEESPLPIAGLQAALEADIGAADGSSSGQRLLEVRAALTDGYRYSTATPSGHSVAALEQYLGLRETTTFEFPPKVGYAEQAASLFAVLARAEGYPVRVAVGYRIALDPTAPVAVTAADAWAWPEVRLRGLGWVPIEATTSTEDSSITPPDPPLILQPQRDPGDAGSITQRGSLPPTPTTETRGRPLYQLALPLLLVVPLVPLAMKAIRRRKRRRGSPAHRVVGSWLESRDRLRDLGTPTSAGFTPRETVGLAKQLGIVDESTAADGLAAATDKALYQTPDVDEADATHADELERAFRRELASRLPLTQRVVARLRPRSLLPLRPVAETPPPVFRSIADLQTWEERHPVEPANGDAPPPDPESLTAR